MGTTDVHDQRERFESRFRSERSWPEAASNGAAEWYSRLLTDLTLATGDEAIHYFSAKFVPSGGPRSGSIAVVAFTEEVVVYANCDGDPGATVLEVSVTARRTLSSFSLESDGLAPDRAALASVRITVNYPQFSRTLPLGASDWSDRESETADLIASLRRDVLA